MNATSAASSQVISLPKGGGALSGIGETFSPDLYTGTGNFTIPIALPPGRNGFQPQLNLVYSTGYPDIKGVLFDQTHVVAVAPALLERARIADRCRVVAGSFFNSVPNDADAYVLRSVIHDWEDKESIHILGIVRQAMQANGTLLLVERVLAPPNEGLDAKFSDLNMLVGPGGRERTREEFAAILDTARFQMVQVIGAGAYSIVKAVPV